MQALAPLSSIKPPKPWRISSASHKGCSSAPSALLRSRPVAVAALANSEETQQYDRDLWFPGSTPPAYLDGSLPGDYGFDPLRLAAEPSDLKWLVQAELIHARFAMAGALGVLTSDVLRVTGLKDLPVWYEAGAVKYDIADTRVLFAVQLILFGFVETKRYMDFKKPGSQGEEESFFFFIEKCFSGVEPGYPGGPIFNPFGLASEVGQPQPLRWKELANGRWAMLAVLGFAVQASVTHKGPIENLLDHLADPGHVTIVETLRNLS